MTKLSIQWQYIVNLPRMVYETMAYSRSLMFKVAFTQTDPK